MTECPDCGSMFRGKKCQCGYDPAYSKQSIDSSLCSTPGCFNKWVINGKCRDHSDIQRPVLGEQISRQQALSLFAELYRRYPHLKRRAA